MKESRTTWERIFFSHKKFCIWLLSIKVHTNSVLIMMYFVKLTHLCFTCTKFDISMTRSHIAEDILHLAAYNLPRTQLVELECMHSRVQALDVTFYKVWIYKERLLDDTLLENISLSFTIAAEGLPNLAHAWHLLPSWGGSSLCHSYTGLWFMWSRLKDCPKLVAFTIKQGDSEDLF